MPFVATKGGETMEAILLVGHGSRDPEGNEELLRFADSVREKATEFVIETCFLEFAKPNIAQGISNCVEQGARRVVLVPIILFAAGHAKIHIPVEIDQAKKRYPGVEFAYGRPIGIHQKVLDILKSRLDEVGLKKPAKLSESIGEESIGRDEDTAILLLGRGSSDGDANGDFLKMSRLLWEQVPVKYVESSFIGVTEPSFPEGLERCLRLGAKKIYVLPYFLFTGILIKRIEQMTAEFAALHKEVRIELAGYFGFHPQLVDLLLDRVAEAAEGRAFMSCDMCKYRLEAAADHDHHHDHEHGHNHEHDHHHAHEQPEQGDLHHNHNHDHDHDHTHGQPATAKRASM
jgi:sirohydrochlorin cobaltochelatase